MKERFLILLLTLLANAVFAQGFKKVVGPSPEASSFSKYTDIPVSNYTGIPNIAIPIYTIKLVILQFPFHLAITVVELELMKRLVV